MNIGYVHDESHGWGIVRCDQLKQARMTPNDFSKFSYKCEHGTIFALEEDADLTKFIKRLDSMGIDYKIQNGNPQTPRDHDDNPRNWKCIK